MGHKVIILGLSKWNHHEDVAVDSQDQKPVALCPLVFPPNLYLCLISCLGHDLGNLKATFMN